MVVAVMRFMGVSNTTNKACCPLSVAIKTLKIQYSLNAVQTVYKSHTL